MGNYNSLSSKQNKNKIALVQTVEHSSSNPYDKTNTVSLLDLHEWSAVTSELQRRGYKVVRFTSDEMKDPEFRNYGTGPYGSTAGAGGYHKPGELMQTHTPEEAEKAKAWFNKNFAGAGDYSKRYGIAKRSWET